MEDIFCVGSVKFNVRGEGSASQASLTGGGCTFLMISYIEIKTIHYVIIKFYFQSVGVHDLHDIMQN